jgi:hypothetical protein
MHKLCAGLYNTFIILKYLHDNILSLHHLHKYQQYQEEPHNLNHFLKHYSEGNIFSYIRLKHKPCYPQNQAIYLRHHDQDYLVPYKR